MKKPVQVSAISGLAVLLACLVLLDSCQPTPAASAAPQASAAAPQTAGGPPPAGGAPGRGRSAVVTVQAETVKFGPLTVQNATAGTVVADTQSSVAAQTTGTVLTLIRKAGDWVNAGSPVVKLDDSQLQLSLKIAQNALQTAKVTAGSGENSRSRLQLESAQKNYDSALALSKIGGISGSDLDTAKANLEAAKNAVQSDFTVVDTATLQVQQAQLNLNYATIKAPFDGQLVSINVQPGEYVTSSTTAFVIVSRAKDVSFNVPPSDVVGLTHGAKITFSQDGKAYPISLVGVPSAPVNGLVPLQAALPAGFPGAYGTVGSVSYSQVMATGVLIPIPAIQTLENTTYVYTIKNNKSVRADITILNDSGSYAAVSGVNDNDSVIVNPPPGLLPGASIKVLQMSNGTNKAPSGAPATAQTPAGGGH